MANGLLDFAQLAQMLSAMQPVAEPYSSLKKGLLGDVGAGTTEGARVYQGGANPSPLDQQLAQARQLRPDMSINDFRAALKNNLRYAKERAASPEAAKLYGQDYVERWRKSANDAASLWQEFIDRFGEK